MRREKIGIDIDDVLARNAEGFTEYSNQRWGAQHKVENYSEDWVGFWDIPFEQAAKRAAEIHTAGVFGRYRHFESAVPVLTQLAVKRDLVVITSRRLVVKSETDAWLERRFPGLFKGVHYAGIWDSSDDRTRHTGKLALTKAELCQELGVEYLIDDQLKHCASAAEAGIKALLFGDYPWNHAGKLPKDVTRVKDWSAVLQYFNEQG
jgi:uncharacterized HAD superfamily protein